MQLYGDAHLSNLGLVASPDRNLALDVNDFDETLAGPWEWDVKRLLASLAVSGRSNGFDAAAWLPETSQIMPASGTTVTSVSRWAAMKEADHPTIVAVSALLPSNAATING